MNTLKNGFVLRTASDVQSAMVPHSDIVDGLLCGVPITKRGLLLTPSEVLELRQWSVDNVRFGILVLNMETCTEILGLEPVDPKVTPPFIKIGDTHYGATRNTHNRLLSLARLGDATSPGYTNDMLNGLWGFADPAIICADAIIASFQHRAGAYLKAKSINPELGDIEFPIMIGLPPQFADFIDRGRERKAADMNFRDPTMFAVELVGECFAEMPEASDLPKMRATWSATIETVRNNVHARLRGLNVHPSGKQAPSKKDALLVDSRFNDATDLQRLVLMVHAIDRGIDGKAANWTKVFTPSQIATAIVLRCNSHHEDSEQLSIDWEYVTRFLTALSESSGTPVGGPLGHAMGDIASNIVAIKKGGGSKPNDREIFQCLVKAIGQWDETGETDVVWPTKRSRNAKERNKDKTFLCFGGVDIGYQADEE